MVPNLLDQISDNWLRFKLVNVDKFVFHSVLVHELTSTLAFGAKHDDVADDNSHAASLAYKGSNKGDGVKMLYYVCKLSTKQKLQDSTSRQAP
jgi:hypothetical protein